MTSDAALAPAQMPAATREGQPQQPQHAKKASLDDVFEHRWRKAYEVRALERESRQAGSRRGSGEAPPSGTASPEKGPSLASPQKQAVDLLATSGSAAAEQFQKLSLGSDGAAPPAQAPRDGAAAALAPTAAALQQSKPWRREQEVEDDDEDSAAAAVAGSTANGHAQPGGEGQPPGHPGQAGAGGQQQDEEEDEGDELEVRLVWDSSSSSRQRGAATQPLPAILGPAGMQAAELKEQGNAHLKAGQYEEAVLRYSQALYACGGLQDGAGLPGAAQARAAAAGGQAADMQGPQASSADPQLVATLHSNRAHALLKLKRYREAASDAVQAHRLHPTWIKPLSRLAQARMHQGQWAAAVAACKKGEELAHKDADGHTEFTPLLDRLAVHAARAGSLAGFDGQQLEVRSAGDEAWLGKAAPHVPELDGPDDEDSMGTATTVPLALPDAAGAGGASTSGGSGALTAAGFAGGGGGDALSSWDYRQTKEVLQRRRTSFRSLREAVEAARDGDRIVLRRGTHNGMGECVTLCKRVLVEGEGELGETTIDQRANVPMFRITRGGVVLRNIFLDQTGFRESLLVDGEASVHPLVQGCSIKCSGDDAVNTGGSAAPTFLRCVISGKKVGVKAYGSSAPRLDHCVVEKCEEQGLRAMDSSAPVLNGCTVCECGEEAVVAMDSAHVTLYSCHLRDCKGPGVDLSGSARAHITGGVVDKCVGGVWAWEAARATLRGVGVAGGPSHALLADGDASVDVRESVVRGTVHATEAAWRGILHPSNTLADPDQPTDFPPEEGPFRFVPDRYTRKQ